MLSPSQSSHSPSGAQSDFSRVEKVIADAIAAHAFPAAALAVTYKGGLVFHGNLGHFTYERDSTPITAESIFDLASLTKVIATTAATMLLYERGLLDLEWPVVLLVPEFAGEDPRRKAVTVRMLLAHSSGLPAYEKLFLRTQDRAKLLRLAFSVPLAALPMNRAEYSDIGFIILGAAIERLAGEPLDKFCEREIFTPLGLKHTTFRPPSEWKPHIVPTIDDKDFRRRVIQGEVHDENAWVLGGVAGHAGVFSTATEVAQFAMCMLGGGQPILKPSTIDLFTRLESTPTSTSRALGWDTPSVPSQSGRYFSPGSFGHLGYTGTSLWIDPAGELSVTLLTNRVWPDCSSQAIKQVRPAVHNAIMEALNQK